MLAAACPLAGARVVILGFDGVDPRLTAEMIQNGDLPNLQRIKESGAFARLGTTTPPLSPVAWSSFSTCTRPGVHGIFDFVMRDPANYGQRPGEGHFEFPQFNADGTLKTPPRYVTHRRGESFWIAADRAGKRCRVLNVPFAYPPDPLINGRMLCADGVPDIRGTSSESFWFSDHFTPEQLREQVAGGIRFLLRFNAENAATVNFPTARDPRPGRRDYKLIPLTVRADREQRALHLELPDRPVTVSEGRWSDWIEWSFPVTDAYTVRAISRVFVIEVGDHVRFYMSCLQADPREPFIPITAPDAYSSELAGRYGLFKTIGWIHDTNAVRKDALPDDVFLDEAFDTMAWRERLTLDEIDRGDFDLLISVWTATDRISHLFWRFRDAKHPLYTPEGAERFGQVVERSYKRMDEIVGKVTAKLAPDDFLFIISDHGFASFRREFSLNTWLIRNGYLTVLGQTDPQTASNRRELEGYDWSKTKAYGLGLGALYLNLEGREVRGIVKPDDAPALLEELKSKLLAVTDPETGAKVFENIYTREAFAGPAQRDAPDLQLAYADGYQTAKTSARGGASRDLFGPNDDKWSGEHAASDPRNTPGILFSNRPISTDNPHITDVGVTALGLLEVPKPETMQGQSFLPTTPTP